MPSQGEGRRIGAPTGACNAAVAVKGGRREERTGGMNLRARQGWTAAVRGRTAVHKGGPD